MIPRYGIIFPSFIEYKSSSHCFEKFEKSFIILPFQEIKNNLSNPFFMKASNVVNSIGAIININNIDEVELCNYLSITNLFFKVNENDLYESAIQIQTFLIKYPNINFIVRINNYELWSKLYTLCRYHPHLLVSPTLPLDFNSSKIWKTSSIQSLLLTSSHFEEDFSFSKNNKNSISFFLIRGAMLLISYESPNIVKIIDSINRLISTVPISYSLSRFQLPMETIGVNLPSYSYEIFESDKTKYRLYELSIQKALSDLRKIKEDDKIILAVVGAGRGPLVDCAVRSGIKNIYIIEKNSNAFELLNQRKKNGDWASQKVELFLGDVRSISLPEKADIIVSELLGSMGDNELAPECLQCCEEKLNKLNGIMIPQYFSSVFVPVMSEFLWSKALNEDKFHNILVVPLDTALFISNSKIGFEFNYPDKKLTNKLYLRKHFSFIAKLDGVCHGIGGWFNATLYDEITMSTSPTSGTDDLFSWFPVFIPFENPFKVTNGQKIEFVLERKGNKQKVWYEWALLEPFVSPIQNPNGNHSYVKLNQEI